MEEPSVVTAKVEFRRDIPSSLSPFAYLRGYKRFYPGVIIDALSDLYVEYNNAFRPLIEGNRENPTDYQYLLSATGLVIPCVQIDMVGLPDSFLEQADSISRPAMRELLRGNIFEIENSIAMYALLEGIFSYNGQDSVFKTRFCEALDRLRRKHGKPIALLALTDAKLKAMRETEFDKRDGELLSNEEVKALSGFDRLFGPDEFERYTARNNGDCSYLLFVRASCPIAQLQNPKISYMVPLLLNKDMRRTIKEHAITPNIDPPKRRDDYSGKINDTKEYMESMGMARIVRDYSEVGVVEGYFRNIGVKSVRMKPMLGSYGCYGHERADLAKQGLSQKLAKGLVERGPYVVQPEMCLPRIVVEGRDYTYIDRVLMAFTESGPEFLTCYRTLMPTESEQVQRGRVHGGKDAVYGEVLAEYDK